eukprot:3339420-Rhodomonas_salina.1
MIYTRNQIQETVFLAQNVLKLRVHEFVLEIDGSGDRRTSGDAEWLRRASGDRLLCMGRGSGDVEVLLCVVLLCRPSGDADACWKQVLSQHRALNSACGRISPEVMSAARSKLCALAATSAALCQRLLGNATQRREAAESS